MPRTLKNNNLVLIFFVGREAFSPVCKGPPYEILVILMNFIFFLGEMRKFREVKSVVRFSNS